ncbi:MAG TPA: hypothetical protein P5096_01455 [Patescibacteria group bacterium]|nr:hypothetical protein [Patescibacteria group bacterium]
MKKILPAILASTIEEFSQKLSVLSSFSKEIQIDITDGTFVNSKTVELVEIKELPKDIEFELHLMVSDPLEYMSHIKRLGIKRVVFHNEIDKSTMEVVDALKKEGITVVLALNPHSDIPTLKDYVPHVDGLLLMSVAPGFGGQELIPSVLEKAKILRSRYPEILIEMDGGIKKENLVKVYEAGVNIAVIGSGILKVADPKKEWEEFQKISNT